MANSSDPSLLHPYGIPNTGMTLEQPIFPIINKEITTGISEPPTPAIPGPIEPIPAPIEPIPAPIEPIPAPIEPIPAPIEPIPAPIEPIPEPIPERIPDPNLKASR